MAARGGAWAATEKRLGSVLAKIRRKDEHLLWKLENSFTAVLCGITLGTARACVEAQATLSGIWMDSRSSYTGRWVSLKTAFSIQAS